MAAWVRDFTDGDRTLAALLGGKGANLAEMTRLGMPVPPGFTITTDACRDFLRTGAPPVGLFDEVDAALTRLERARGQRLGDPGNPLLLSVRSGARYSMPGMMDTILDVGLNDETVEGLAAQADDERFAWDSYRRLITMYARTVLQLKAFHIDAVLNEVAAQTGASGHYDLEASALRRAVRMLLRLVEDHSGRPFPQDPRDQLRTAVIGVFASWTSERARVYRRREGIPHDLGTAVNVQAMVFGNLGLTSGTGVAFTRDPATGAKGAYGDYLPDAQGEDVVAGERNTLPLTAVDQARPGIYDELLDHLVSLERHYRDLCDIEFTVERGGLWLLQTRVGKRSAEAAFRIATDLVDEGVITMDEALLRVTGDQLAQLTFPRFTSNGNRRPLLAKGMNASPGAAVGEAVFDTPSAIRRASSGAHVILVRRETTPDDLPGMVVSEGVLTSHGGRTSHAAVVARGMGKTAVCGAESLDVDVAARRATATDGRVIEEGDVISIDGTSGEVFLGEVTVTESPLMRLLVAGGDGARAPSHDVASSVLRLLAHADAVRRLGVRANADTAQDADRARRLGAEGIGLLRTEHMFMGERRVHIERLILATTEEDRRTALDTLLDLQRADFIAILEQMDGLPVTIRLLDPPLHEFLPDITDLSVKVAVADAHGEEIPEDRALLAAVRRLHEANPMLGLRGVRLGIVTPGLVAMQSRAIAEAVIARLEAGGAPMVEIMVPLVATAEELRAVSHTIVDAVESVQAEAGVSIAMPIGTMIELPRAALVADRIAEEAEFFSFGTNDLTQTTWGFSRDDVEGAFFSAYLESGILAASPFETLDRAGVGELIAVAVERGRQARPGLTCGICGEHGGEAASIHFVHDVGLDYVSCSPFRVPSARLEAGRAALLRQVEWSDTR